MGGVFLVYMLQELYIYAYMFQGMAWKMSGDEEGRVHMGVISFPS